MPGRKLHLRRRHSGLVLSWHSTPSLGCDRSWTWRRGERRVPAAMPVMPSWCLLPPDLRKSAIELIWTDQHGHQLGVTGSLAQRERRCPSTGTADAGYGSRMLGSGRPAGEVRCATSLHQCARWSVRGGDGGWRSVDEQAAEEGGRWAGLLIAGKAARAHVTAPCRMRWAPNPAGPAAVLRL